MFGPSSFSYSCCLIHSGAEMSRKTPSRADLRSVILFSTSTETQLSTNSSYVRPVVSEGLQKDLISALTNPIYRRRTHTHTHTHTCGNATSLHVSVSVSSDRLKVCRPNVLPHTHTHIDSHREKHLFTLTFTSTANTHLTDQGRPSVQSWASNRCDL